MNDIAVITDKGQYIKYSELDDILQQFASNLTYRSIVGIVASNTVGSLVGYTGCICEKHIPLLLPEFISAEILGQYIECYRLNYLWLPNSWLVNYASFYTKLYKTVYTKYDYSLLKVCENCHKLHEELALLLLTSGTTGGQKLVRISYKNLIANTKSIIKYMKINEEDRAITALPMNHAYGLSVINTHLYSGGTILITSHKAYEATFWLFFRANKGNSFAAVPYTYELLRKLGLFSKDVISLKKMTVAGDKMCLSEEEFYIEYAEKYKKEFVIMYGQTEATARISYRPIEYSRVKMESVGIAIPDGEMWLKNTDEQRVSEPYKHGEIVYKGDNVAMGYANSFEDLSRGYDWGNVLHTGDIGYMDEDGYYYIVSRKDRNIKINGNRVDLQEIEKILHNKYKGCKFVCNIEKCIDVNMEKRIKIEIDCLEDDIAYINSNIVEYLVTLTGFNRTIFNVCKKATCREI